MSAMTQDIHISPKDLGSIPRKTSSLVCDLVNNYGVRHRLQKGGGHLYLYNGETQTRPYKISASRPEETTLAFLYQWIEENVPEYAQREEVRENDLRLLASGVTTKDTIDADEPEPEPTAEGRTRCYTAKGDDLQFETDGEIYYCLRCSYTQNHRRGMHLHNARHELSKGEQAERISRSVETRKLRAQQRDQLIEHALAVIVKEHGFTLGGDEKALQDAEADLERYRKRTASDAKKIADLTAERDDLKAKLSLIKEAMRA